MEKASVGYLFKLAGKSSILLLFSAIFSIISGIMDFVPLVMLYRVLMFLFGDQPNIDLARQYAIYAGIAIIVKFLAMLISGSLSHIGAFNTLYEIRKQLSIHIATLNLGFFTKTTSGKLKKTIIEDTERIEQMLAHQVPDLAKALVAPLLMFGYLCTLHVGLALFLLLPIVLGLAIMAFGMRFSSRYMAWYQKLVAQLNSSIMQFINGMNVMKSFNVTAKGFKQYSDTVEEYHEMWTQCSKVQSWPYSMFLIMIESGLLFSFPLGGWMYLQGSVDLPTYLFFLIMSIVFLSSFKSLSGFMVAITQILSGTEKIKDIMDLPQQHFGQTNQVLDQVEVAFEHVHFSYEEDEVLHDVSLTIPPNTLTAFVGVSGSGKSTTAQLVPRFWDIQKGQIRLNGHSISDFDEPSLMESMSFVFQDAFMLSDTIRMNISVGKDSATEEEIHAAAEAAQIHDFIMSLPDGYDTVMGEAGIKMSGGEKQRICIARAILKNAPLVIFDEATSFTDIENERKIQLALNELLQNKTTIMIAHRLNTIKHADQICIFDQGRIVERGTHEELLLRKGTYAKLWAIYAEEGQHD
ncbi:ABC transporter ATP-binding protein [Enterococcus sp. 669A]|uniref:ABC transporter ATP-binding protein n=1 Tax=Candidatus Enterococcus moelleringii TaxID=2815325 RepID=A0ABS3LDF0_9ENTE|nr:ABC transporter ATP-binding protein [Enterococcus sp. 669A]MBO1307661.1 ABC transporter ATP-binding protein [Enterococcus sp. 669A]